MKTFEVTVRNLLQQENFTNFTVVSEDIAFVGERVRNIQRAPTIILTMMFVQLSKVKFTGRTFTTSIMNGGS